MYRLTATKDNGAVLSWLELGEEAAALRFARWDGGWGPATTVTSGSNWFVNWADRPSVTESGGILLAHWLERTGSGARYGYSVRGAVSADGGESWPEMLRLGADNTSDYTGFAAVLPTRGGFMIAYLDPALDGPDQGGDGEHALKTLRLASVRSTGEIEEDNELDGDVCTCCPVGIAETSAGPAVVYRDHSAGEIRDISIVRRVDGAWTAPQPVVRDGWEIHGCPVNGPAIAAAGERVAVAWFTAAGGASRVRLALSEDAGATFGTAIDVDDGDALGWVGAAWVAGRVAVSWIENDPAQKARGTLRVRIFDSAGDAGPSLTVTDAPGGRSAGVPQLAVVDRDLLIAWRDSDQVHTAVLTISNP